MLYIDLFAYFSYNMDYFSSQSRWALPNNEIVILKEGWWIHGQSNSQIDFLHSIFDRILKHGISD